MSDKRNVDKVFEEIATTSIDGIWFKVNDESVRRIFDSAINHQTTYPIPKDVTHYSINSLKDGDPVKNIWRNELKQFEIEVHQSSGKGIDSDDINAISRHVCRVAGECLAKEWERYIVHGVIGINPPHERLFMSQTAILTHPDVAGKVANKFGDTGYVFNESPNIIDTDSVKKMIYYLPREFRINSNWYSSAQAGFQLGQALDVNKNLLVDSREDKIKLEWVAYETPVRMLGKDIYYSKWLNYVSYDLNPLMMADLSLAYHAIRDENETVVKRRGGQLDFKFSIGGAVIRPEAIKLLKMGKEK